MVKKKKNGENDFSAFSHLNIVKVSKVYFIIFTKLTFCLLYKDGLLKLRLKWRSSICVMVEAEKINKRAY